MNNRKIIIAGNWKMNKTREETLIFIENLKNLSLDVQCDIILCVPFTNLETAINASKDSNIKISAQNCHFENNGAFTGEISPIMLKEMGIHYTVIGHSERREYFSETDIIINKKIISCINNDITAILCVGESLNQRELNITDEVISMQIKIALESVSAEKMSNIIIAYEPIWAIGTGKTATHEQANKVCELIRNTILKLYNKDISDSIHILYGGSMNTANSAKLLEQPHIDGGLIGGASLKVSDFSIILNATATI